MKTERAFARTIFGVALLALGASSASAQSQITDYRSLDDGCPADLQVAETYQDGRLVQVQAVVGDPTSPYKDQKYLCGNVIGKKITYTNYDTLTCLASQITESGYTLSLRYEVPSKDPSDYGMLFTYSIEKSGDRIQAHWGQRRPYDGKPIYCAYQKL